MTELCPSLSEAKRILKRLRQNKSEVSNFDFKETLNLKEDGDRASFIRHIAALANLGQKSGLFIGIEDKTWISKGIPSESPLLKVDVTQQQMNQILAKKIDPSINVEYRVYDIDGLAIGIVGLDGKDPPYVISIEEPRYGGSKTKGKESYIYKGVIYIRHGTASVPANRQREILEVFNGRRDYIEIAVLLVFIGVLVAIGVGIGVSQVRFPDTASAALLGGIWGIIVGWILNKRLADSLGKFPTGTFVRVIRIFGGSLWGGAIGALLSYLVVDKIITGQIKILDPVSMAFVLVIVAVLVTLIVLGYINLGRDIVNKLRRGP